VTSQFTHPPLQLMWCEAGHGWWRFNPTYIEGEERTHSYATPRACPEHTYRMRGQSISEAMRRSHLRREAEMPGGTLPEYKVCTGCKKRKHRSAYGVRYTQTKAFGERVYMRPQCLACEAAAVAARNAAAREADPEGFRERRRLVSSRNNHKRRHPEAVRVDPQPFIEWWTSLNGDREGLSREQRETVRRVVSGRVKTVEVATIDELCTAIGRSEMVSVLYGRPR
jgi:hypothetical protein